MTNKELLQQALDALEWCYDVTDWPASGDTPQDKAIKALRTALAQPEKEWVGLTDEESEHIVDAYWNDPSMFIEVIEAALKAKNDT